MKTIKPAKKQSVHDQLSHVIASIKSNVDHSKDMLDLKCLTSLTLSIDAFLNNPLTVIAKWNSSNDELLVKFIDMLVKEYFNKQKSFLTAAYKSKNSDLHYCIALKSDNIRNRNIFNNLVREIKTIEGLENFSVYFQFVPSELVDKVASLNSLDKIV